MNSLGIDKKPADTRVVVAMSGGVDSSVTAGMLARQGYDVVGITLQLYDHGEMAARKGACCAGQDIYDARSVADRLGFPHYVLDYESRFSQAVIDDFADSYARGETPVPCIRCNQRVKFRDLMATARDLGADALATGHYVRRKEGADLRAELHKGADPARDQSYFLFATTQDQLDFLRFPLGDITKAQTREIARSLDLEIADKPDSQDICFVPDGRYADIVAKLRPESIVAGEIMHMDGRVLGTHDGFINFTIGQRRGLGIGHRSEPDGGDPLYVVALEPATQRVIVGPRSALARRIVHVKELNWLGEDAGEGPHAVSVKLRSAQTAAPASLLIGSNGKATLMLEEPQFGIAAGQACVIYRGERVLGGGWITAAG